ncbi:nucleotidyl transferase [Gordonia phage Malachai]|nr:nucleotidyltransferase [Gordonia phage Begonia]UVF60494.1 nucleotidyl transferase [Gordonia phage Malachai]
MTKHNNPTNADIADRGLILRGQVGSGLHGVTTGADDRDEMGVCIEPPDYVVGLNTFDQYEFRTQPDHHRSGAGDLDLVVYSLRKWVRLAAAGNPTILLLLFIPDREIVHRDTVGISYEIQAAADLFVTRQVAAKFGGYLVSQKERMLGLRSQRTNRPELVDTYGFDTKFAYHMVRLGLQGVELLTTGRIQLPIAEPDRTWLTELRAGKHTKEEALDRADDLLAQLNHLRDHAVLPERPDMEAINEKLIRWYNDGWEWLWSS